MLHIKDELDRLCLGVILSFLIIPIIAKESEKWVTPHIEQVHVGNFSLPTSQQPGPLLSFGQNIVDKGNVLAFVYPDKLKGKRKKFFEIIPSILYGITDKLSLFVEIPVAVKFQQEQFKSHGIEDVIVQLEGIVYVTETATTVNEITAVGNISLPTGSFFKQPPTGFGSPTFFLGTTLSRSKPDWYYFCSLGGIITTMYKQHKTGNLFLYQFGVGRNIAYKTDGWILNWLVELDGIYAQHSKTNNIIDRNSGGNSIVLGPSLFFSTRRFLMQGGISAFIEQHQFGIQLKNDYLAAAYVGWKF